METRTWAKDSFWENYDQNRITTVLTITHDDGKVTKQQLTVNRYTTEGDNNPDFDEIISMEDHLKAGGFGSWIMENVKIKNNFKHGYISNSVIGKVGDEKWLLKNLIIK